MMVSTQSTIDKSLWIPHLLRRAGFGYSPEELAYYQSLGYERAVETLLNCETVNNSKLESSLQRLNFTFTDLDDLKNWWLYRMAYTKRPLEEKITLFWHGHFATSDKKVKSTYAMHMQNMRFRKYGLGGFDKLLFEISKDPAMVVWLDNQQNRKGKPNENYAREIMELFTLGIGNYSENDVKEAARAFTGWQVRTNGFFFNQRQHDYGYKSFLGYGGNLGGEDIVNILCNQKATSRFLAKKLLKFFVIDEPDQTLIDEIAEVYFKSGHSIKAMLQAIFYHPVFLSVKAYHGKIKSPVELAVGTIKTLQIKALDPNITKICARMGQNLFMPPSVKGWDGGNAWIATDTMMERFNFAAVMVHQKFNEVEAYIAPSEMVYKFNLKTAGQMVDYFANLLIERDLPDNARQKLVAYVSSDINGSPQKSIADDNLLDVKIRGLVHLIMCLPAYQLC